VVKLQAMGIFKKTIENTSSQYNYTVKLGKRLSVSTKPKNILRHPAPSYGIEDSTSAEGLFRLGLKYAEQLHYNKAVQLYLKSLKINDKNPKVLTRTAEAFTHKAQYKKAFRYANQALAMNTYDPGANFIYGVINRRLGNLDQAKAAFGWAARSMKYRSAGYEQIAEINMQQHKWDDAVYYANEALDYNKFNVKANKDLAIAYRKQGNDQKAKRIRNKMLKVDPLCHFAYFEQYLLKPTRKNLKSFTSLIRNEFSYETYLEIAMDYYHAGLNKEAEKVLKKSPAHPMVYYWLAYLNRKNAQKSAAYLNKASAASPKLVFPFRWETIPVLKWAIKNDNNW
jgi:tetratricopeptide (TPR) repeat protein